VARVVLVVFDGFQLLDLAGPAGVFDAANQVLGRDVYTLAPISVDGGTIRAGNGIAVATGTVREAARTPIDILLVAGGWPVARTDIDRALVDGVAAAATRSRRVAAVC
jgi:transcriptional regulator GlxA family with amidase domain